MNATAVWLLGKEMGWDSRSPKTGETGLRGQNASVLPRVDTTWSLSEGEGAPSCCFGSGGAVLLSMGDAWPEMARRFRSTVVSPFAFERVVAEGYRRLRGRARRA